jgi:hypothetical protein
LRFAKTAIFPIPPRRRRFSFLASYNLGVGRQLDHHNPKKR